MTKQRRGKNPLPQTKQGRWGVLFTRQLLLLLVWLLIHSMCNLPSYTLEEHALEGVRSKLGTVEVVPKAARYSPQSRKRRSDHLASLSCSIVLEGHAEGSSRCYGFVPTTVARCMTAWKVGLSISCNTC